MGFDPVSLAVTATLTAMQMALQMSRKIEGPRQDSLDVTVADYGTPLNYFIGTRRFAGVPIMWAEPIREVKRRAKTKGGKFNEYSYFGSWAVVVADHEIDKITRIWFDKHLVYDATGTGPLHPFNIGTTQTTNKGKGTRTIDVDLADHLRIYLGTETQTADPRMLADVEAKHGVGSCPDYKGVAYIVFEEVPLEKFGNRIPQISVEGTTNGAGVLPFETLPDTPLSSRGGVTVSPSGTYMIDASDFFHIWHLPSRTQIASGNLSTISANLAPTSRLGLYNDGHFIAMDANRNDLLTYSSEGVFGDSLVTFPSSQAEVRVLYDKNNVAHVLTLPFSTNAEFFVDGTARDMLTLTGINWNPIEWVADSFGDIWALGRVVNTTVTTLYLYRMVNSSGRTATNFITITGLSSMSAPLERISGVAFASEDGSIDRMVVGWDFTRLYAVNLINGTLVDSAIVAWGSSNGPSQFANAPANSKTLFLSVNASTMLEIDLATLDTLRTIDLWAWMGDDATVAIYAPSLHAIAAWDQANYGEITFRYLDRDAGGPGMVKDLISRISTQCGVDPADIITTEMTQSLNYSWVRAKGRDVIEPVLDAHNSIVRPHDFGNEFITLDRATDGTISSVDFVSDGPDDERYGVTIEQDTDLPRRVTVNYSDITADQQPNIAMAQVSSDATDGVGELSIDLSPMALTPTEAQRLTERWLRRRRFEREGYDFRAMPERLKVEPGDNWNVLLDGIAKRGRFVATTIQKNGIIKIEMKRYDAAVATLSSSNGQPAQGHEPEVLLIPVPTKAFVLDSTLIRDADETAIPFLYIAGAPRAAGTWLGASIYEAPDATNFEEVGSIPSGFACAWGYSTAALHDVSTCGLWDRGIGINVKVPHGGPLTSITEAAANANPMLNRIIWENGEQTQFTTATLQGDGSYTLTGLKRGRRGTEWATGTHVAGEGFLVVGNQLSLDRGASDIGRTLYFKTAGAGDALEAAPVMEIDFAARTHKPFSPVHFKATKDSASGDWSITWVRRTRIGGAWVGGASIPVGEPSERYILAIMNGAVEVRTFDVTSEAVTYTAAQQVTDFGSQVAIGNLDVGGYQVSDIAGRGFGTTAAF